MTSLLIHHASRLSSVLFYKTATHCQNWPIPYYVRRIQSNVHHSCKIDTVNPDSEVQLKNPDLRSNFFTNDRNRKDSETHTTNDSTRNETSGDNTIPLAHEEESFGDYEIGGVNSPVSAMCWHKGPYHNDFGEDSNGFHPRDGNNRPYNASPVHSGKGDFLPQSDITGEMEHLISVHSGERDRVRLMMDRNKPLKIDQHIRDKGLSSQASTLKLLSISSSLSKRRASSRMPQLDPNKYLKEKMYQKLLSKNSPTSNEDDKRKKRSYKEKPVKETIRILDVDRLPLPILHHALCYTLVKNLPAENVLKIISNIATLRDKNNHICYKNLFNIATYNSSSLCAPEIVAILTRSYQSVSIPFMVDYVRRYGTFSRKFLSNLINRHSEPFPLDFLRYESHSRRLPTILTRPWSLISYVNLLKNSSAKRYMYLNLLNYGYVPQPEKFDKIHSYGTMDYDLAEEILSFEKLGDERPLISENKEDPNRPKIYSKILELQYTGEGNLEDLDLSGEPELPSSTSLQNIKVIDQGDEGLSNPNNTDETHSTKFKDVEETLPEDRSHISWTVPWGLKRDRFHYRGKTYALDRVRGWLRVKSNVRINYLKNVQMNSRKRERRLTRRRAEKQAKLRVLSTL